MKCIPQKVEEGLIGTSEVGEVSGDSCPVYVEEGGASIIIAVVVMVVIIGQL